MHRENLVRTTVQLQGFRVVSVAGDASYCGDGVFDSANGEACDDENGGGDDGCSATCQVETGWDCDTSSDPSVCHEVPDPPIIDGEPSAGHDSPTWTWSAPAGTASYRYRLDGSPQIHFVIESAGEVRTPERYRNKNGQILEHSPFCERDIRRPETLPVNDETGEFRMVVKARNTLTEVLLDHDPRDVVGWDGYYYPWALNIEDFEPIVGRLHQPPPVHQTFAADGFVICSFVPRLYDFHPDAVKVPYHHANTDSDEVLFYSAGNFMSRAGSGIGVGSLSFHPAGFVHGPQPGSYEASVDQERTEEIAVMIDTFAPLGVTDIARSVSAPDYPWSWAREI